MARFVVHPDIAFSSLLTHRQAFAAILWLVYFAGEGFLFFSGITHFTDIHDPVGAAGMVVFGTTPFFGGGLIICYYLLRPKEEQKPSDEPSAYDPPGIAKF